MSSHILLLISVINLFANTIKQCSSIIASGPNAKYFEVATQFMNDAHLFYSAVDNKSMFRHITDDFIWHWEGDKTISKEKYIELNKAFYGMNNHSTTQFLIDAIGDKYCGGISYAWFERGDKPCKSWMYSWEVFIFTDAAGTDMDIGSDNDDSDSNDKPMIKERYSFPVNKRVYTSNNNMLSSPKCKYKKHDDWDYSRDEKMEQTLENKMLDYMMYSEMFYRKRDSADNEPIDMDRYDDESRHSLYYDMVSDNLIWHHGGDKGEGKNEWRQLNNPYFDTYDEVDLLYEMDVYGEYFTGGFVHNHVRIGECRAILMHMVIAYFNWDIEYIEEILFLPVDQSREEEFAKCVEDQRVNTTKNEMDTECDDNAKKEEL